ncbi:MAG: helix-turn-helix domain-containing protein [Pseudomonadota bacterium]
MTADEFSAALVTLGLSIDQFAEQSGTHRSTVYRWIRDGDIPKWAVWLAVLLLERRLIVHLLRD